MTKRCKGQVIEINIAPSGVASQQGCESVVAQAGAGLEGDRYASEAGTFSKNDGDPGRHLTLVEAEQVEAFTQESGVDITPAQTRRNLVTRGIDLNALVGKRFKVGPVEAKGIRLCEPCSHLGKLTDMRVVKGLAGRGGLRAEIVSNGTIRVGDVVEPVGED